MFAMRISKHSPDNCPMFEARYKDVFLKVVEKHEMLAEKHGIKIIGAWVDSPAHTVYSVYDTPSIENLIDYTMEPEMVAAMNFQTSEIRALTPTKELAASLKG